MGRHIQQKEAVLSPGVVEGANQSHFKTLFQDPSPVTGQNEYERTETSSFQDPKRQTEHTYSKNTSHTKQIQPNFRTIIHDSNHRNGKMKFLSRPQLASTEKEQNKLISRPSFKTLERTNGKNCNLSLISRPSFRTLDTEHYRKSQKTQF